MNMIIITVIMMMISLITIKIMIIKVNTEKNRSLIIIKSFYFT